MDMTARLNVLPELSHNIIGCAIRVHSALGPGLLESFYEEALSADLTAAGIVHRRQVPVPVSYRGRKLGCGFRIDVLVEEVVVEVKAIELILPVHESQLASYLRASGHSLGLLINFNVPHLRQGIRRRVLTGRATLPLE
jgi:GxxExxY protein